MMVAWVVGGLCVFGIGVGLLAAFYLAVLLGSWLLEKLLTK